MISISTINYEQKIASFVSKKKKIFRLKMKQNKHKTTKVHKICITGSKSMGEYPDNKPIMTI